MTCLERLDRVFQQTFSLPAGTVTLETTPDQVAKWDSIGHMHLVVALEKEFSVQFEVDQIMEMSDVSAILRVLAGRGISD